MKIIFKDIPLGKGMYASFFDPTGTQEVGQAKIVSVCFFASSDPKFEVQSYGFLPDNFMLDVTTDLQELPPVHKETPAIQETLWLENPTRSGKEQVLHVDLDFVENDLQRVYRKVNGLIFASLSRPKTGGAEREIFMSAKVWAKGYILNQDYIKQLEYETTVLAELLTGETSTDKEISASMRKIWELRQKWNEVRKAVDAYTVEDFLAGRKLGESEEEEK